MTATADLASAALSNCNLVNFAPYVVVDTWVDSGSSTKLVLLRDPSGPTTYTGAWKPNGSEWTSGNSAGLPLGYDPTSADLKAKGYFVVPITKFAYDAT